MTDPHYAEIQARLRHLASVAGGLIPTKIPLEPLPSDILRIKDDLEVLWGAIDPLLLAIGEMLVANGMDKRNLQYFRDQLRGALEGNATHCIDEMAEDVREALHQAVA